MMASASTLVLETTVFRTVSDRPLISCVRNTEQSAIRKGFVDNSTLRLRTTSDKGLLGSQTHFSDKGCQLTILDSKSDAKKPVGAIF
jgi:hypothetical protein